MVDVPSLKYLEIVDSVVYDFRQMENMPALEEACVWITSGVTQKFLKPLTSVHRLSLWLSLSEVITNHLNLVNSYYCYSLLYMKKKYRLCILLV